MRKLSPDELKAFLALADQVGALVAGVRADIEASEAASSVVHSYLFGWGQYYTLPPLQHLSIVLRQFGLDGLVVRASMDENPASAILKLSGMDIPDEMVATESQRTHVQKLAGLMASLHHSFRAVGYYGKWMHELIAAGDDESLLRAVTIDPVASGCQAFQDRLAQAVFFGESEFVERFATALKGPSKKISRQHNRIRVAAKVLLDAGALPMPEADLVDLFCDELKLYKAGVDPGKALKKLIKVVTPTPTT